MSWQIVDTGHVGPTSLELYAKDGEYMLRAGGLELMNSLCHDSEDHLASAAQGLIAADGEVLIGGLGLGYTLAAFLTEFPQAKITVAELSPEVVRWYREHFRDKVARGLDDSKVEIINADVQMLLERKFDLVVLDVDNGPEPLSAPTNAGLYSREGLLRIRASLNPGGALLLWSAFESGEFTKTAYDAGFKVEQRPVRPARMRYTHHIYLLRP